MNLIGTGNQIGQSIALVRLVAAIIAGVVFVRSVVVSLCQNLMIKIIIQNVLE
jgi:hypothetical protein